MTCTFDIVQNNYQTILVLSAILSLKNCWNKVNQEFSFGLNEFTPGQKFYSCSGNFGVKLGIFLFLFLSPTDNDDINTCVNNENDDNNNKDNEKK